MKRIPEKLAAVIAFGIGAMAAYSGSKVLVGIDPGYHVINWLPLYNYTAGVLTLAVTAALIWRGGRLATALSIGTFALHATVMTLLQTAYRDVVASESIKAMTIRLITWGVILVLLFVPSLLRRKVKAVDRLAA
jgi:hypothetical protein